MASLSCCTSCQPPSPDGPPPRPVESPSKLLRLVPEDYLPEKTWSFISRLSNPEDAVGIQGTFEDKSDTDDEGCNVTAKKSSRTLNAVKSKLRQHLSRDSAISKRQSRSVGTSEEEVERRKELKRLNHRRIQEELSNEGVYDDDAESLSTIATTNNLLMNPLGTTLPKRDSTVMSPLITLTGSPDGIRRPTYSQLSNSRDPFEVVTTLYIRKRSSQGWAANSRRLPDARAPTLQRRHSSAEFCRPRNPGSGFLELALQDQNSACLVPPAPVLKPQELPSIVDSASRRTSWRLSFTSDRRSSQLRSLSQEHKISEMITDDSRAKINSFEWLWGQGARKSSQAITDPSDNPNDIEELVSHTVPWNAGKDFKGVDGSTEIHPPPIHLHEMRISQRLASTGLHSHSSSPQLSSLSGLGQHWGFLHSSKSSREQGLRQSRSQYDAPNLAGTPSNCSPDDASSLYSAGRKSIQSPSETSWLNLASLLAPRKSEAPDSKSSSRDAIISLAIPGVTPRTSPPTTNFNAELVREHRRLTMDSSNIASETASFRERETELSLMKTRFPKSMERQGPVTPIQSRFKEEFDEPRAVFQSKSSILSALQVPRMTKLATRSYDGSGSVDLQIPGQRHGYGFTFTNRSPSTPGLLNLVPALRSSEVSRIPPVHMPEESAEELWTRALKKSQEERARKLSDQVHRNRESEKKRDSRRSFMAFKSLSWRLRSKTGGIDNIDQGERGELPLAPDEEVGALERAKQPEVQREEEDQENIEAWTAELKFREEEAKIKSAAAREKHRRRVVTTPESWARFPSHTRSERNEAAGPSDSVSQQDFAIKKNRDGVIEWMIGERKYHHDHDPKKEHHSKLPARLSKQLRTSLYKLRTSKSSLVNDALHGRKSSISVGGDLEFPELEILPAKDIGEGELAEMEREVAEELRQKERNSRMIAIHDGSQDGREKGSEPDLDDTSKVSIADPKFYEDCLITLRSADHVDCDSKSDVTDGLQEPLKRGQETCLYRGNDVV